MAAKLVVLFALVAAAHSSVVGSLDHAAVVEPVREDVTSFSYDVADPYTGDFKSQSETRVGGTVQGQYSLLDADGTKRTVDYAADDFNGFNAVVRKDTVGVSAPVVAAKVVAPAVARTVAAPLVTGSHVVTGGAVLADRYTAPSVYAASAPLVTGTVYNGGVFDARGVDARSGLLARNVAAPYVHGGARFVDTRFTAPTVLNTGLLSRTYAAPTFLNGGARLYDSRSFTDSAALNAGLLSRTVAAPLVTRTLATPGVYAASAPLVTGAYSTGHDLFGTHTFGSNLVSGGLVDYRGRLTTPFNTYAGRLVAGHNVVRTGW